MFWTTPHSKPYRLQYRVYPLVWMTLARTRTVLGAYDASRGRVTPGHYRIAGPDGYRHYWEIPAEFLSDK